MLDAQALASRTGAVACARLAIGLRSADEQALAHHLEQVEARRCPARGSRYGPVSPAELQDLEVVVHHTPAGA